MTVVSYFSDTPLALIGAAGREDTVSRAASTAKSGMMRRQDARKPSRGDGYTDFNR